jgi:hypothetical protein
MLKAQTSMGGVPIQVGNATWARLSLVASLVCFFGPRSFFLWKTDHVFFLWFVGVQKVAETAKYEKGVFCLLEIKYQWKRLCRKIQ